MLGDFGWGEYFIWHLASESKVFVDSSNDMVYPLSIVKDYIVFYYNRRGAEKALNAYHHDFVIIPPAAPAYAYALMVKSAGWKLLYRDPDAVLFARADSPGGRLPATPQVGVAPVAQYFP